MKKIIIAILMIAIAVAAGAQNRADNPMTRAVLRAYDQILAEDPTDGDSWLHRAVEYYNINDYMRALNDVNKALQYIPAKEKDNRIQAYLLRANIYVQTDRDAQAIPDLDAALALDPQSILVLYQRGNSYYKLGKYDQAKADYTRIQRLNSRNPDCLIGLARVAIKENNLGLANEYLDDAVALNPNDAEYYVRRASVRRMMQNDSGAVEDLILAIATGGNSHAISDLVSMADTNYGTVMSGLTNAIRQAPRAGAYRYIRGMIAQAHYNYAAALDDFKYIVDENIDDYAGIYASMAECQFALTKFDEALDNIDRAIASNSNKSEYYVLKSQILRALERYDEAYNTALRSTVVNPGKIQSITQLGLCEYSLKNYASADNLWGEALMTSPDDPMLDMLRAWVLGDNLNKPVAAKGFYQKVLDSTAYEATNVRSLQGFAMLFSGDRQGAINWIENILASQTDHDGFINYMAACLYAQAGDDDHALDCTQKAVSLGYSNLYDWLYNNDARITVAPIRDNLRFLNILNPLTK